MKNVLFISKPPDKNNIKMSVQKLSQEEELEKTAHFELLKMPTGNLSADLLDLAGGWKPVRSEREKYFK